MLQLPDAVCFIFFNDTATTEIYTLSLHDARPIWSCPVQSSNGGTLWRGSRIGLRQPPRVGRSEEHTSELSPPCNLVCRLLLDKKKKTSELQSPCNLVCRLLLENKNIHTI